MVQTDSAAPAKQNRCALTLVVPGFNEEENIDAFYEATVAAFESFEESYQIVFVDDGSRDATFEKMQNIAGRDNLPCEVTVISFSRNFGKEAALYAGLEYAFGDVIGFIDADLQQHPETLLEMYRILMANDDCDVVAAYQSQRTEGGIKNWLSEKFYGVLAASSHMDVLADASDFRVFRRYVAQALLSMPENDRFSKGLFSWIGFKTIPFPYVPNERNAGHTTWSYPKLLRYAIDGLMSFSTFPLKVATYIGWFSAICAILYLIFVIVKRFVLGADVPGYATIVVLVLFFGSIQLLVLGSVGSYLGRDYIQGKGRPIYIARRIIMSTSQEAKQQ
ncbi:MAG: glycosyltransferase family 2 protein [Coriobacteriales bacterium]|nr:glycosyltransferase family 2 protein [Coriobacteriales bacterium]